MSTPSPSSPGCVPRAPCRSPGLAVVVLALLLSIQPVTTDLYLPALPALTRALGAPVAAGQLTLSALLLALAARNWCGAAGRPLWPPPGPAGRVVHLCGGLGGQRPGAVHGFADCLAHRPGRRHGCGGDVRPGHRARSVYPLVGRAPCPRP